MKVDYYVILQKRSMEELNSIVIIIEFKGRFQTWKLEKCYFMAINQQTMPDVDPYKKQKQILCKTSLNMKEDYDS